MGDVMIKINEIFYSIQGESSTFGLPTIFIRTSGCHLRCTYCDTQYAYYEGKRLSAEEILKKISKYNCKRVCITGGEPLLQKNISELFSLLLKNEYKCSIETSGDIDCSQIPEKIKKIIDVKTPDSGEPGKFDEKNLQFIGDGTTEYKFVICSEADFEWSLNFAAKQHMFPSAEILFSPCYELISPEWLAQKILESGKDIRMQLQLHKIIWPETKKGV